MLSSRPAVVALSFVVAVGMLDACSGKITQSTEADGAANSPLCPSTAPGQAACANAGLVCTYVCDGTFTCKNGNWTNPSPAEDCSGLPFDAGTGDANEPPEASDPTNPVTTCNADGAEFGPFEKKCAGDGDCAFAFHETSCCGDGIAIAFNASQASSFAAAEQECDSHFPGCGCPSRGDTTEENADGGFFGSTDLIKAICDHGKCMTTPK
jgi:hypothetical protein